MEGERGGRAQVRAQQAADRLTQLRERNLRLRSGAPAAVTDVRHAGEAAARAVENAAQARQDARTAYRRAAQAHRQAASTMHTQGHLDRATWHLAAGVNDDLAAEAEQLTR
jgi:hypothetical protein